jgi:hypothetical protein
MRKDQLLDLIRRVNDLTGIITPVIVGSHSLFAVTDKVPAIVSQSIEADFLLGMESITAMRQVNAELGVTSDFYDVHGYHADALGLATVVLVSGWEERLQPLQDESGQVIARCLELHDVAVSKLMAGRDKDFSFITALLERRLISLATLTERAVRIQETASADALLPRLRKLLDHLRQERTSDLTPLLTLISRLT